MVRSDDLSVIRPGRAGLALSRFVQEHMARDPHRLSRLLEVSYGEEKRRTAAHWIERERAAGRACPYALLQVGAGWVIAGPPGASLAGAVDFMLEHGSVPEVEFSPYADWVTLHRFGLRGLTVNFLLTVLVRPLDDSLDAGPFGLPAERGDLEFRAIDKSAPDAEARIAAAARTCAEGFADVDADEAYDEACLQWMHRPEVYSVEVLLEGRVAGVMNASINDVGTSLEDGAGVLDRGVPVAHFYKSSVLRWARRRGVQTAMLAHRLRWAREQGAGLACIDCDAGRPTERNARRLGFETLYTKPVLLVPDERPPVQSFAS